MSPRLLALVLLIGACASTPKRARRPGREYLAAIKIEGNTVITSDTLIPGLSLNRAQQGGRGIDEYQLELDVSRIAGAYQRRGYLGVRVEPKVARKGPAVTLTFVVTEGPRATASIEIVGLPPEVPAAEARALVKLEDGAPFNYVPFDEAKAPLLALVENAGYAHAQLDATILADPQKSHAILRYAFDSGPKVTFGAVEVIGTDGDLAEAVRGRVAIKEGEPYSTKAVADGQLAIYGTGRFTSVHVDVDRSTLATVVPVKITVVEAKRWEARAGIGAGLDSLVYQARMRFSLSHAGWPTPLTTLGIEFRPALVALRDNCDWYAVWDCELNWRIKLIGTATQQDLFFRGLNGELEGGLDYLALEAYTAEGARARTGLNLPLNSRRLRVDLGYLFGYYRFEDIHPAVDRAALGIDRRQRLGAFTQAVVIDYRDDPIQPTVGGYAEFRITEGTAIAGGAFDYLQMTPDARGYLPLGRVVLAARARLGVIRGEVPPTERYYAGGASSQRGFAERRLSPLATGFDADGNETSVVIGGAASFETSFEVRSHFKPWGAKVGVVAFLDGADVTNTPDELKLGNLHWAVGLGIRPIYLPVGPIRFEVGYRLNRTGAGEPSAGNRWNYLLSVGEAF